MKLTDKQFIQKWNDIKSPTRMAEDLGLTCRSIYKRRAAIERKYGISLECPALNSPKKGRAAMTPGNMRREMEIDNGMVVVFSDAHFWPDEPSTAYLALLNFLSKYKQQIKAVVNNGDAFDGASISRFPPLNWGKLPTVKEELEACASALEEIEKRVVKSIPLIWCLGNHDARYEQLIINNTPQLDGIRGTALKDWFPMWKACYSFWINDVTVIKHRWKGGAMAGRNNTIHGGVNIVTGHTHVGCVNPFNDYNGIRYGVQTGTLANPNGRQFEYTEDNPKDWMQCFAVLSYVNGNLLMPELVRVFDDNHYEFRGELHEIKRNDS